MNVFFLRTEKKICIHSYVDVEYRTMLFFTCKCDFSSLVIWLTAMITVASNLTHCGSIWYALKTNWSQPGIHKQEPCYYLENEIRLHLKNRTMLSRFKEIYFRRTLAQNEHLVCCSIRSRFLVIHVQFYQYVVYSIFNHEKLMKIGLPPKRLSFPRKATDVGLLGSHGNAT